MMALARLQRFGHSPIAVVGGGTGLIGDPSGKTAERQLLTPSRSRQTSPASASSWRASSISTTAAARAARQQRRLADDARAPIDFMRDVGKHFTVNAMLQKESVKRRIESEDGISYTEFSYSLLQAYDFLELYDRYGCTLQMGGSDQWGNITAGMDLIRRAARREGARPRDAADDDRVRHEVRQDRSRNRLAGSGADVAVRVLSVLAEHGRSGRR